MPQTIAPLDILTSGGQHNEREKDPECTTQVRINAADLAERVSKLLDGLSRSARVSSGFRTRASNKAVGGAPLSNHTTGSAVDLEDADGTLAKAITTDIGILARHDLYMEHPDYTKGWVHLQITPTRSGRRVFVP